jgi:two-component system, chemotaxis family, response regulator Rcp1
MKTTPEVLLVDDNPADIDLTSEVLAKSKRHFRVHTVADGAEAIAFLRRQGKYTQAPSPDLVVLDLNLPRKDGREVLSDIKADPSLAKIPVVIFTTSQADSDVSRSYELGANCYLRKPGNLEDFVAVVQSMADFWLGFASLPQKEKR